MFCGTIKIGWKRVMYVYIIESEDGSYYTGMASNIVVRLRQHYFQKPQCAKYTKSHKMVTLKGLWVIQERQDACKLEYRIKQLTRTEKQRLISRPTLLAYDFHSLDHELYKYIEPSEQEIIMNKVRSDRKE